MPILKRLWGMMCHSLNVQGSIRALKMAINQRRYKNNELIHHSDRGLQYCSNEYQGLLSRYRIKCSMSESYDPYQNAVAERVNGILKYEFINGVKINDIKLMRLLVKESIDIYNHERPHYSCHMKTSNQMHKQNQVRIKNYKKQNSSKNVLLLFKLVFLIH